MNLVETVLRLKSVMERIPFIDALWLEGSYASGTFTPRSDIDVWMSVSGGKFKEAFEEFEKALKREGVLRNKAVFNQYSDNPQLAKAKFYLKDNSDDQRIELDIQSSDRDFEFDRKEHSIVILFDKDGIIKWRLSE